MSRGLRLLGATALACASLPLFAVSPAHAASTDIGASNSGYFYAAGVDKPDASPAKPPNLGDDTDGVDPGHIAVASKGGSEDKVSFLYFDVFTLPPGAVIDKAVVSLTLVPNSPPKDISYQAAPANVVACMAGDQGFSGDEGVGIANAPSRLCDKFKAVATASADAKAYLFDITALASGWLTGANDGVAFTRAVNAPSSNFQVVFDGVATAKLAVSYTVPVETTVPTTTPPVDVPTGGVVAPPTDLGGGGFAPPPATTFDPGTVIAPPTTEVMPPVTQPAATNVRPVAALSTSMRPTNAFWLGGLALVIALGLISLVCGDPRVSANQQRSSRLTKALSARSPLIARPVSW